MIGNNESNENLNLTMESMDPEAVDDLCEQVRQRDLQILKMNLQIKWYEDSIAEQDRHLVDMRLRRKKLDDEERELDGESKQLRYIRSSVQNSCEMEHASLSASQALKAYTSEELKSEKLEALKKKEQLENLYMEAEKGISETPRYKELQKAKAQALIADMHTRQLQLTIRTRKSIIATKRKIDKIQFQNFSIRLALYYTVQQKEKELENIQAKQSEKMVTLLALQKKEPTGRVKMTNIADETGNQDPEVKQDANMSELVLTKNKKLNNWDRSKLCDLLKENESISAPAFASSPGPKFPGSGKRKGSEGWSQNFPTKKAFPSSKPCFPEPSASTQESEANASFEISQHSSQGNSCSLKDKFRQINIQNLSMFKKPLPVQVDSPPMPKQNQINPEESVNKDGPLTMTGHTSQSSPASFWSQPTPQSILTSSKDPNGFKTRDEASGEQPKSVTFNLEQPSSPLNMAFDKPTSMAYHIPSHIPKRAHSRVPIVGNRNPFDLFSTGNASPNQFFTPVDDAEQPSSLNSSLNFSLPEVDDEGDAAGMELDNSGNENNASFSYGNGSGVPRTESAGGFFSFDSTAMFSFK